jgi:phosphate transport system protein
MPKHLHQELEALQRNLLDMATAVEGAVHKAVRALQTRSAELAREVIAGDSQIDHEDNHINEECLKMLALHQPVAGDLRRIAAAMMITIDLERMGDLAEDMAGRAVALTQMPALAVPTKREPMANLAMVMVRQALESFGHLDPRMARSVWRLDDEVDRFNDEIIQELIEAMKASPEAVEPGLSLFSAVRHLERIADHATNIAEDVIYLVEGEIVRHHPEALRAEIP